MPHGRMLSSFAFGKYRVQIQVHMLLLHFTGSKPAVHYRVHNSPLFGPLFLSHIHPDHVLRSHPSRYISILSSHLCLDLPSSLFILRFFHQNALYTFPQRFATLFWEKYLNKYSRLITKNYINSFRFYRSGLKRPEI